MLRSLLLVTVLVHGALAWDARDEIRSNILENSIPLPPRGATKNKPVRVEVSVKFTQLWMCERTNRLNFLVDLKETYTEPRITWSPIEHYIEYTSHLVIYGNHDKHFWLPQLYLESGSWEEELRSTKISYNGTLKTTRRMQGWQKCQTINIDKFLCKSKLGSEECQRITKPAYNCTLNILSFGYSNDEVELNWEEEAANSTDPVVPRLLAKEVKLVGRPVVGFSYNSDDEGELRTGLSFNLRVAGSDHRPPPK